MKKKISPCPFRYAVVVVKKHLQDKIDGYFFYLLPKQEQQHLLGRGAAIMCNINFYIFG